MILPGQLIQQEGAQKKPEMKTLLILTCVCLFVVAWACTVPAAGSVTGELHIRVVLTTGERSKDSNSKTTTISLEQDAIVLEINSSRDMRRGKPPVRKEFKLSATDKGNLLKLIRTNNLLVTDSIELPQEGSNIRYFRISVDLALGEEKGAINISGLRTASMVKEEKLYQNSLTLVKELYRIMNSQDQSVHFEELILEPVKQ